MESFEKAFEADIIVMFISAEFLTNNTNSLYLKTAKRIAPKKILPIYLSPCITSFIGLTIYPNEPIYSDQNKWRAVFEIIINSYEKTREDPQCLKKY